MSRDDAERYRLAWTSARRRAKRYNDRVNSARQTLDELADLSNSHYGKYRRAAELLKSVEAERDEVREALADMRSDAGLGGDVALVIQQRDDARQALERVATERDEARERANEAARLSAEARDRANDQDKVIADLREQVSIVDSDRLTYDAWALNVLTEHGLTYDIADLRTPIADYLRALTAERDRLGEQAQHLVNRCTEFRTERDEARAEVVRLGKALDAKRNSTRILAESCALAQAEVESWRTAFGDEEWHPRCDAVGPTGGQCGLLLGSHSMHESSDGSGGSVSWRTEGEAG